MNPETINNHFQTGVILRNPTIDKVGVRANILQAELKHLIPDIYIEDTHREVIDYQPLMNKYLASSDIVWITMGGDGIHSNFANALLANDVTESPVMFFPAGNANDIARSLASFNIDAYPEALINYGEVERLYPLEVKSTDEKHLIEYAIGYFGLGYSGDVALALEQQDYRAKRDTKTLIGKMISDGELISDTLHTTSGVTVYENDKPRLIFELLYANGPRMARGIRFRKGSLTKPEAVRAELDKPSHIRFAKVIARAAILGNLQYLNQNSLHQFSIKDREGNKSIWGQRDGQPIEYASETKFDVKISDKYVNVLTNKLK